MYFEDIRVGMTAEIAPAVIEKQKMLDFARDYDPIPLHTDEEYAKTSIFGGLIAPGVMSFMSIWANFIRLNVLGDELIAGKSTKIEWFKPVFAGDSLTGKARITKITPRNDYNGIVDVTIEVFNQHGELVLTDVTESIVKRRD
jgi:acyl dehydratase